MKKRLIIMVIGLVIVFGGIMTFNLIKSIFIKRFFATFEMPAVTVSSTIVTKRDWEPKIKAVGNIVALNGVEVNSQAAGNVTAIHFDSGQYIQSGQALIEIDAKVEDATLKFNQSDLTLQKINFKRQVDLFKRGATPSSNVDEAKAKLLQAKAQVEKTEALIQQKHISAPFSGQVGIRQVNLGQYITPGQTSIVTLQSMDPLYLEFYLPEQLLQKIHLNQSVTFSIEQKPGMLFAGKITAINAKVDIRTHNIQVQATIPNCPTEAFDDPLHSALISIQAKKERGKMIVHCSHEKNEKNKIERFIFIPGLFADIEVEQPTIKNVIVLPSTAISYSLYGDSVFLIRKELKKDKDGKDVFRVKRTFITIGEQQGNYTVIQSGLKEGQKVVSSGELKLQDDTRVVINNSVKLADTSDPLLLGQ